MKLRNLAVAAGIAGARLLADTNPGPTQSPYAVSPPFSGAALNQPFPDAIYGADHGGSALALSFPFASPFGFTDHAHGVFTYTCAPFTPRNSEGVYGMDVWLEQQDSSGNWGVAAANGGVSDQGVVYQPVNTPNPGPSPGYSFTWTYGDTPLPAYVNFRIFVYVYLYNQGGGSQGNFYVASATGAISSGAANDPPRIAWTAPSGAINPGQVAAGQTYVISADAQDDNGNLATVSINKNGVPFAYAGGGNGYSGNSQNPTSDPPGTVTYTAWAGDSMGAQSPTITWSVTVTGKLNQAPVSSTDATLQYGSGSFTPAYEGGSGTGGWQFCIAGYTNWTVAGDGNVGTELFPSNAWSPSWPPPGPGTYYFWVGRDGDATYNPSAPAGLYTLTVTAPPPLQAQTISFAAPGTIAYPWAVLTLDPTATSGLPVSLSVVSGPATLSGSQLTITGPGAIVVQASQPGNGQWLAAPTVSDTITAGPPPEILRVRFNANGLEGAVSAGSAPSSAYGVGGQAGTGAAWTDPTGIETSPWPTFAKPQAAAPAAGSFPLPAVTAAPVVAH